MKKPLYKGFLGENTNSFLPSFVLLRDANHQTDSYSWLLQTAAFFFSTLRF